MKKNVLKIITTAIMLIAPIGLMAQHLEYKGIPIDGKIEKFAEKLEQSFGYDNYKLVNTGCDWSMAGVEYGNRFDVYVYSSPLTHTTYQVILTIDIKDWAKAKSLYMEIRKDLDKKYTLDSRSESFERPYYDGDGFEIQAFNLWKAQYSSYYKNKYGRVNLYIMQGYKDEVSLNIAYIDNANEIIDEKEEDSFRF